MAENIFLMNQWKAKLLMIKADVSENKVVESINSNIDPSCIVQDEHRQRQT